MWTTPDFLQLKTVFPSTRNGMFCKKHPSRLYETPTSELGFSDHRLGRQKKTSKTQGFSTFFWGRPKFMSSSGSPGCPENRKSFVFLSKTLCFGAKIKKTQCFFILYEAFGLFCVCQTNHKGLDDFRFFLAWRDRPNQKQNCSKTIRNRPDLETKPKRTASLTERNGSLTKK